MSSLSRIALLIGVTQVAGFSTMPKGGVSSRSGFADSCTPCTQVAGGVFTSGKGPNCEYEGFCYYGSSMINTCLKMSTACEGASAGSAQCQKLQTYIERDPPQCPEQEGTNLLFCTQSLRDRTLEPDNTCANFESEAKCNEGYIKYQPSFSPSTLAGLAGDYAYQACIWQDGACKKYMVEAKFPLIGGTTKKWDAVSFCADYCTADNYRTGPNLGTLRCNQGQKGLDPYDDPDSLAARLKFRASCIKSFFSPSEGEFVECQWNGPTDDEPDGGARCNQDIWCTQEQRDLGICNPNCNCLPSLKQPCRPMPVECCDADSCYECTGLSTVVSAAIYARG